MTDFCSSACKNNCKNNYFASSYCVLHFSIYLFKETLSRDFQLPVIVINHPHDVPYSCSKIVSNLGTNLLSFNRIYVDLTLCQIARDYFSTEFICWFLTIRTSGDHNPALCKKEKTIQKSLIGDFPFITFPYNILKQGYLMKNFDPALCNIIAHDQTLQSPVLPNSKIF
jgi:hypothetical protein